MKKRIHVFYSGRVHGVGFRFTARHIAHALDISGWVKNLNDGRVEVVAEGEEERLSEFLNQMKTGALKHHISHEDIKWQDCRNEFEGFDIKFDYI